MSRFSLAHPSGARTDLVVGNSLDLMRRMKAGSVGVVATSPPYNLGIKYEVYDDTISRADYLAWSAEWIALVFRVLSDDGSFFLNVAGKPTDPLVPFQVLDIAIKAGFVLQNNFTWVKSVTVTLDGRDYTVGHVKPLNSDRFSNDCHESIFHLTKSGRVSLDKLAIGVPYQDKSNLKRFGAAGRPDLKCRGNVWPVSFDESPSSEFDARWIALFLDTEGSIYIAKNKKSYGNPDYRLCVEFTNTHRGLIDELATKISAGGTVGVLSERPPEGIGKRDVFRIMVTAKEAASLLVRVYPYLIVKKKQAAVGLFLESLKGSREDPGFKQLLDEESLALRERLHSTMKALNDVDYENVDLSWIPEPSLIYGATNVWTMGYDTIQAYDDRPHPASFPVELPTRCLKLHGVHKKPLVLDPFAGIGTTALACARLGLPNIGVDLGPLSIDWAVKRLQKEVPGTKVVT